ncbi:MAG: LuxR C-terminal-related transcriptional regulator, partial [Micropruina sp.]|uniref:helix-turn-helix transcriptional regulator n=1 Tax=Micropruina sp. TaxID=2737536 RepID=UPI0039E2E509
LARAEAVLGRERDCATHLSEAKDRARAAQDASLLVQASVVGGFLSLSRGDPSGALAQLEAVPRLRLVEDAVLPWAGELLEALVRTGCADEAGRLLTDLEGRGSVPPALRCAMDRAHGLLAEDPADAVVRLIASVDLAREAGLRIDEARGLTVLGEVLTEQGSVDGRRAVMSGAALFDALGALNWHARALDLVRDPVTRPAPADGAGPAIEAAVTALERPGLSSLTAQELRVAELAADGLTNQQLAAALFLSVRTVESHLSNVYRKLQVRRRAQLVRLVAVAREAADPAVAP